MKKIITICAAVLMTASVFLPQQAAAQAPEKMSYQAVIRNAQGALVTNQNVGMRISIQKWVIAIPKSYYSTIYAETQNSATNENGLVSLKIGDGSVIGGVFANIDWSDGEYYIKTETDPSGGTNYNITGTSQLLSVPYALSVKNLKTYKIGDFSHGGIVFWVDESGQHGLVCAKTDQSTGVRWSAGTPTNTMARGDGTKAGFMNTAIIISNQGYGDGNTYAARICSELQITEGGKTYGDWYLPSKEELNLMYINRTTINNTATANGGISFTTSSYWSSTETGNDYAWRQNFDNGVQGIGNKELAVAIRVRAIRAF